MKSLLTRTSKQRPLLVAAALLFVSPFSGFAQIITTYAGGNVATEGTQAVTQVLEGVDSVISDRAGGFYFTAGDVDPHKVYRVSLDGTLTTVAGTGSRGYSGDGGLAIHAQLNGPKGLALDGSGNLYIADTFNHRIRKVSPAGTISTVVGVGFLFPFPALGDGGPATAARLSSPSDVAVDATGALFIADTANNRIRKVTAGIISTVAGTGNGGFSGDGGPATLAQLGGPSAVEVDASGNILIADLNNNRIRRVTLDGIIRTIAGNGTPGPVVDGGLATQTSIAFPNGLAVDAGGNILIADTFNDRIRKVDTSGIISTIAGTGTRGFSGDGGPATSAQLFAPTSVALDLNGSVFIADSSNQRIRKITGGVINTVAGLGNFGDGGLAKLASIRYPTSIALDSSGNLYVSDTVHSRIRKISSSGAIGTLFAGNNGATGIAVDASGNVYFSDCGFSMYKATPGGTVSTFATNNNWYVCDYYYSYYFASPAMGAIAVAPGGNLFVANTLRNRIETVSPSGQVSTFAGGNYGFAGDGGPASAARFANPWGLAFDAAGNLYIADVYNNRIRKVTPGGVITTVAGSGVSGFSGDDGLATSARLSGPTGVAVDAAGNLYIADSYNHRIRRVNPSGVISTVAGTGSDGFGGDNGLATAAQLSFPTGLAVDAAGNLFISDSGNNRIRRIGFVRTAPILASLSPSIGVPGTSVDVTLSGSSFANPLTIDVGSGTTVTNVTVVNDSLVTATINIAADATLGVRNLNVTTDLGASGNMVFTVVAPFPDLAITSSHQGNLAVGFDADYVVAVSNKGLAATTSPTTMTDALPPGVTYVSGVGDGWSCTSAQQVVSCVHPDSLPPGASTTVNLKVAVAANVAPGVIHAPQVSTEGDLETSNNTASDKTVVAVPVVTALFTPEFLVAGVQGAVDLRIPFAFPHDVSGTLTLGFTPDVTHPADDPAIQFSTGGRTVTFMIPANTLEARFGANGQTTSMAFQAGTIAGNLSFSGTLQTGTVETAFSRQTTIPKQAPKIHSVQRESSNGGNFSLGVQLTSSPREVTALLVRFVGSRVRLTCGGRSGCSVDGNQLALDVRSAFDSWFIADTLNGSASTLHVPFFIDADIKGTISISLVNRFGTSNSMNYTLP